MLEIRHNYRLKLEVLERIASANEEYAHKVRWGLIERQGWGRSVMRGVKEGIAAESIVIS